MRLSSDNPETMPITDGVYGRHDRRRPASDPRGHTDPMWRRLSQADLDKLASRFGGDVRRFAARRRQGT